MAYKYEELEQQAIEAINEHELVFVTEVPTYLQCSTSTFYDKELEKSEHIKDALNKNRVERKQKMRNKWYDSDNATLQMGAMKLLSTPEELRKLSMETKSLEGKDGKDLDMNITIVKKKI